MDNLIFCLNATVPIFAIILLGRLLRGRNFFSKQTLAEIDKLSFKVLLPILLFRDIAAGRITEQFNAKFFFFSAGVTALYFFAIWAGAALFLRDKSMVGAFTQGAFRGSQAILGVAFVQNLYGDAGLVPLMIVASVPLYNIFSVLVLTVTAPDARTADYHGVVRRTLRGIITNPIILGIFAGLPFSLLAIDFPPMLDKGLSMLGNCATPMALLSIGAGFEGAKSSQKPIVLSVSNIFSGAFVISPFLNSMPMRSGTSARVSPSATMRRRRRRDSGAMEKSGKRA